MEQKNGKKQCNLSDKRNMKGNEEEKRNKGNSKSYLFLFQNTIDRFLIKLNFKKL
jgi:hypothetical protein